MLRCYKSINLLEEYEREVILWSVNFTRPLIQDQENYEEEHIGWSPCRTMSSHLLLSRVANLSYYVSCNCQHLYSCIWMHRISIMAWFLPPKLGLLLELYRDIVFSHLKNTYLSLNHLAMSSSIWPLSLILITNFPLMTIFVSGCFIKCQLKIICLCEYDWVITHVTT